MATPSRPVASCPWRGVRAQPVTALTMPAVPPFFEMIPTGAADHEREQDDRAVTAVGDRVQRVVGDDVEQAEPDAAIEP